MEEILKQFPVLAVLPLVGEIFSQLKGVKKRSEWIEKKKQRFGSLGGVYWFIDVLPVRISQLFAAALVTSSVAFLITKGLRTESTNEYLNKALDWNENHYSSILLLWLVNTILVHTNGLARLFWCVAWMVPSCRTQIGFTNATWHIRQGDAAPAIAMRRQALQAIADEIVTSLLNSGLNTNLALRPAGLRDDEAANVLFFGHVIECALTENNVQWASELWTAFYEALGAVAKQPTHPLAPHAVASFSGASFHHEVIASLNNHRPLQLPELPETYDIPARIDAAREVLTSRFAGSAQNIGSGLLGYSYQVMLNKSRKVPQLELEGIRRQFAKLAILWKVWPNPRRPATFKIAFSRRIAMFLLSKSWIRTDAASLPTDDKYFLNTFDRAQSALVELAARTVLSARDNATQQWRNALQQRAQQTGLDWDWYLRYRIDQHIYHLAATTPVVGYKAGDRSIDLEVAQP